MEMMLVTAMSRETILRSYLSKVKDNYDYVLIDCMPSLGMVTLNALAAADSVIIPVQAIPSGKGNDPTDADHWKGQAVHQSEPANRRYPIEHRR